MKLTKFTWLIAYMYKKLTILHLNFFRHIFTTRFVWSSNSFLHYLSKTCAAHRIECKIQSAINYRHQSTFWKFRWWSIFTWYQLQNDTVLNNNGPFIYKLQDLVVIHWKYNVIYECNSCNMKTSFSKVVTISIRASALFFFIL